MPNKFGDIGLLKINCIDPDHGRGERIQFWFFLCSDELISAFPDRQQRLARLDTDAVVVWKVSIAWSYSFIKSEGRSLTQIAVEPGGEPQFAYWTAKKALESFEVVHREMRGRLPLLRKNGMAIALPSEGDEFVQLSQSQRIFYKDPRRPGIGLPMDCPHRGNSICVDEVLYLAWRDGELPSVNCTDCNSRITEAPFCTIRCTKCKQHSGQMPPTVAQAFLEASDFTCVASLKRLMHAHEQPASNSTGGCAVLLAAFGSMIVAFVTCIGWIAL